MGVVTSNPQRALRLVEKKILDAETHTDAWGIVVHTGRYKEVTVFVASVPMGGGGSGFAFLELFASGARSVIRYGSNDKPFSTRREILAVTQADGLYGLMRDSGAPEELWGTTLPASPRLIEATYNNAQAAGLAVRPVTCHHVEDYHVRNFPHLADSGSRSQKFVQDAESRDTGDSVWDMETAALYWRAQQFEREAATVLQSLTKNRATEAPYEGSHGEQSLAEENTFFDVVMESLVEADS